MCASIASNGLAHGVLGCTRNAGSSISGPVQVACGCYHISILITGPCRQCQERRDGDSVAISKRRGRQSGLAGNRIPLWGNACATLCGNACATSASIRLKSCRRRLLIGMDNGQCPYNAAAPPCSNRFWTASIPALNGHLRGRDPCHPMRKTAPTAKREGSLRTGCINGSCVWPVAPGASGGRS